MNRARRKELRQRCDALVEGLAVPVPFDLVDFCRAFGAQRGRPLRVAPHPLPTAAGLPCGVWVELPEEDVIFVEPRTTPVHQEHIGLHEIAHIVCGHRGVASTGPGYVERLLPDLDPAMVSRVLGRTSYGAEEEREAELMATLLGERLARSGRLALQAGDDEAAAQVLAELARALGASPGR